MNFGLCFIIAYSVATGVTAVLDTNVSDGMGEICSNVQQLLVASVAELYEIDMETAGQVMVTLLKADVTQIPELLPSDFCERNLAKYSAFEIQLFAKLFPFKDVLTGVLMCNINPNLLESTCPNICLDTPVERPSFGPVSIDKLLELNISSAPNELEEICLNVQILLVEMIGKALEVDIETAEMMMVQLVNGELPDLPDDVCDKLQTNLNTEELQFLNMITPEDIRMCQIDIKATCPTSCM